MSLSLNILVLDLTSRTPPYDRRLCEALQKRGCNVELWAAGCHTDDFDKIAVPRCRGLIDLAVHIPGLSAQTIKYVKGSEYIVNLIGLAVYLWRVRPDILHVQWLPLLETLPQIELAFLQMCDRLGIPVVYTVHDILPLDQQNSHWATYRRVYHSADRLICHTEKTQHRLVEGFGVSSASTCQIPHGPLLDTAADLEQEAARNAQSLPRDRPIALLFGVLRPYKGVETLITAWQQVEQHVPEALLIIAGGGQEDYVSEIREKIEEANTSAVQTRLQFLPEEELSDLIAAADLLVYPYRRITQSGALLAGMNAGKAIVASRVGGLKETLDDDSTGQLVPPDDPEALAEALADLLSHPNKRRRLAQAAQSLVNKRFSWDVISEKTVNCYRKTRDSR